MALPDTAPVLTSAVFDPGGTIVEGSIIGTPFTQYQIDFFVSDAVNPGGFGDGQTYLESNSVFVDDSGSALFQIPLDDAVPVGQWITATATDSTGTTSQFFPGDPGRRCRGRGCRRVLRPRVPGHRDGRGRRR